MIPTPAYVAAIGFAAPGLPDWPTTRAVLRGERSYVESELGPYQPEILPPNERRRASLTVRMAFRVAEAALQGSGMEPGEMATVFASGDGDLAIASRICQALAEPQRRVSPTDFHNSVHNAAAGYLSIASGATGPSTAIAAHDHSLVTGLIEALGFVQIELRPTLLVAYDIPAPMPLQAGRAMRHAVGLALLLVPQPTAQTFARLSFRVVGQSESRMSDERLEELRLDNPAARALPLLQALVSGDNADTDLPLGANRSLRISCTGASAV